MEHPEPKKPSEHHEFVAAFDALFRARAGTGANWTKIQHGQVKALLKKHGLAECSKRARRLFAETWWFVSPGSPPTLGQLVQHFDELAVAASKRAETTSDQLVEAARLERAEREAAADAAWRANQVAKEQA